MGILCIILATLRMNHFRGKMLKFGDNPISCINLTGLKGNGSILFPPPTTGAGGAQCTDLWVCRVLSRSYLKPSVPY